MGKPNCQRNGAAARLVIAFVFFALCHTVVTAKAQTAAKMLIEPAALQKHLQSDRLRIIDARSRSAYEKSHIPAAVWVDLTGWRKLTKTERGFHKTKEWGAIISGLGIAAETPIVVYGDSLTNTARVWWLLKYAGLKDVRILNGGWQAWVKNKGPINDKKPAITRTNFRPKFQSDRLEEIETLKKTVGTGKVKVVDTRSDGEFTGKIVRGKRGGHIPGATHLEWTELVGKDGRFKSTAQLRELFKSRGLLPKQKLVCY